MPLTADVWTEIDALLAASPHVTLATADATGRPQAATIGVAVVDGRALVFDTLADTRKFANITANPRVAVVVGWHDHKTLQLEGTAEVIAPDDPEQGEVRLSFRRGTPIRIDW